MLIKPKAWKTHRAYSWSYCTTQFNPIQGVTFNFAGSRSGQHLRNFLKLSATSAKLGTRQALTDDFSGYKAWQVDNSSIEQLVSRASAVAHGLIALEATHGYEFEAACALQAAGLAVAGVDPRTPRDFARVMAALAKTDGLDARMLEAFARALHQHLERARFVRLLADAKLQQLQAPALRQRQLVQMLTSERLRSRMRPRA